MCFLGELAGEWRHRNGLYRIYLDVGAEQNANVSHLLRAEGHRREALETLSPPFEDVEETDSGPSSDRESASGGEEAEEQRQPDEEGLGPYPNGGRED
jgi:hypothetical protein